MPSTQIFSTSVNSNYPQHEDFKESILSHGKQQVDETREDPLGTTKAAYAKTTQPTILTFPAHSAPIDFKFLTNASGFPKEYKDDALVCWHGSWNRL